MSPGTFLSRGCSIISRRFPPAEGIDLDDPRAVVEVIPKQFGACRRAPRPRGPARRGRSVIAFLASRRNNFMTGADVNVDGGSDFC